MCRAFTLYTKRRVCILKSGLGEPSINTDAISEAIVPVVGVDFDDGDLDEQREVSIRQCQDLCIKNDNCKGFSFVTAKSWCFLKDRIVSPTRNKNVVSWIKQAAQAPVQPRGNSSTGNVEAPSTSLNSPQVCKNGYYCASGSVCIDRTTDAFRATHREYAQTAKLCVIKIIFAFRENASQAILHACAPTDGIFARWATTVPAKTSALPSYLQPLQPSSTLRHVVRPRHHRMRRPTVLLLWGTQFNLLRRGRRILEMFPGQAFPKVQRRRMHSQPIKEATFQSRSAKVFCFGRRPPMTHVWTGAAPTIRNSAFRLW